MCAFECAVFVCACVSVMHGPVFVCASASVYVRAYMRLCVCVSVYMCVCVSQASPHMEEVEDLHYASLGRQNWKDLERPRATTDLHNHVIYSAVFT